MSTMRLPRGGWVTFAGVALLVAGVLDGLVALNQEALYEGADLIFGDRTVLGTTFLLIGAVEILTGVLVFKGRVLGQFLGVMVAGLNGFWHFLFIGAVPARSIPIMVADGLIIYALTGHGESFPESMTPAAGRREPPEPVVRRLDRWPARRRFALDLRPLTFARAAREHHRQCQTTRLPHATWV